MTTRKHNLKKKIFGKFYRVVATGSIMGVFDKEADAIKLAKQLQRIRKNDKNLIYVDTFRSSKLQNIKWR
jgi:hypothetical protein